MGKAHRRLRRARRQPAPVRARASSATAFRAASCPSRPGLAFAHKLAGSGGIVAVCIGDGTLGEGVVYETFNIASKWQLPLLIVLENNLLRAVDRRRRETLAGDICARAAAFGIETLHGDTWQPREPRAATARRRREPCGDECRPVFVRVDTYRLAAHSKGDDDRDRDEIATTRGAIR